MNQAASFSLLDSRKGAVRIVDIPQIVLSGLNTGNLASVNLIEWLSVDGTKLLEALMQTWNLSDSDRVLEVARDGISLGVLQRSERIALALNMANVDLEMLSQHKSDTVRCWAAFIAVQRSIDFQTALEQIQSFAADLHFGVREIAWMALRPQLIENLDAGLKLLSTWTQSPNPNLRRFASECSRPRGVWCAHIQKLKDCPEMAVSILEPLRSDPNKYVQMSVANWLNDASKTQADWVQTTCARWCEESPTKSTNWIAHHALRSLRKKSN